MKNIFTLIALTHVAFLSPVYFQTPNEMLIFVKDFLPENPVILEAGGHYGEDTLGMKTVWPDATMYVFEPLPSSFEKLVHNTKNLSGITLCSYALSNYSGKTNFYLNPNNDGASSIGFPVAWNSHEFDPKPFEVQCITLDEWANDHKVSHIDFMWLDMEGHELYALQSASTILHSVKAIYTEVDFVHVRENSCLYSELKMFLEKQGFDEVWKSADYGSNSGDALFIRK